MGSISIQIALSVIAVFLPLLLLVDTRYSSRGKAADDRVTSLPGLDWKPNFKHYAGYLSASEKEDVHFFYWFFESQRNPQNDPLLLWLNGGPGCSGMFGLLTENGPFILEEGSHLRKNEYAWNKISNVLYIESPSAVGFSFADNGTFSRNDETTAEQNIQALRSFRRKFPQFRRNSFYIAGESYAGVYIPYLAEHILKTDKEIAAVFKGYMIGNGVLDKDPEEKIEFAFEHRLISTQFYTTYRKLCCKGDTGETLFGCESNPHPSQQCKDVLSSVKLGDQLNTYGIYSDCYNEYPVDPTSLNNYTEETGVPHCNAKPDYLLRQYFSKADVRKALHVNQRFQGVEWRTCNMDLNWNYSRIRDVRDKLNFLIDHGIKGLIFNGDADMSCTYQQNENALQNLRTWNRPPTDLSAWLTSRGQVGGFHVKYHPLMHFATVKGAGHMVPTDRPEEALALFGAFVNDLTMNKTWF